MGKRENIARKMEYEEMERGGLSASFQRPPWHLTAAGMGKKEEKNGIRKETYGGSDIKELGAVGRGVKDDR